MTLAQAQALYQSVLGLKEAYQNIVAEDPGVVQGVGIAGQALASDNAQAQTLRAQLSAAGYSEAANVLASDDYQAALQWYQDNPDLGVAQTPSGGTGNGTPTQLSYSPGTGTSAPQPSGNITTSSGTKTTVLGAAYGFLSGLVGDMNGIVQLMLNPGKWWTSLGRGVGSFEQSVGSGLSAGSTSASSGLNSLWNAIVWPAVILGTLYAVDRIAASRRRRRS